MLNTTNSNSEYLHNYIRKVAKQEQESVDTSSVYTGTIEAAQSGIYTIVLNQSDNSSSVLAIPIVSGDVYDKDDSVYLLRANTTATVNYFIVGKVNAIQEAFFNLTELERFNPNESKVDLSFGNNDFISISEDANNIFNSINALGYFQLEVKITSKVEDGAKIIIYLNYTDKSHYGAKFVFSSYEFIGQPGGNNYTLVQKKIFHLPSNINIKNIRIEKVGDFSVAAMNIVAGSLLEISAAYQNSIIVQNDRNYFEKEIPDTSNPLNTVTLTSKIYYNNKPLVGDALQYYWFLKDDSAVNPESSDYLDIEGAGNGWRCLNIFTLVTTADEQEIRLWDNKNNFIVLNKKNFIIPNEPNEFVNFSNFVNKVKCIVKYFDNFIESDLIDIYNYDYEQFSATLTTNVDPVIIIDRDDEIQLECKITNNNSKSNLSDFIYKYEWYLGDTILSNLKDSLVKVQDKTSTTLKEEDIQDNIREMENDIEEYYCKVSIYHKNDVIDGEVIEGKQPISEEISNTIQVTSAAAATDIQEEVRYKYYIADNHSVTFKENTQASEDTELSKWSGDWDIYDSNVTKPTWTDGSFEVVFNDLNLFNNKDKTKEYFVYYTKRTVVRQGLKILRKETGSFPQIARSVIYGNGGWKNYRVGNITNQLNTFNQLTNNGEDDGIYYSDIPELVLPQEELDWATTYYKKIVSPQGEISYQPVQLIATINFKKDLDYYIYNNEEKEYDLVSSEIVYDESTDYYKKINDNEYQKLVINTQNFDITNIQRPEGVTDLYKNIDNKLFINATYIRSGTLEVKDKFYASIGGDEVIIAGYSADENILQSQDGSTGISSNGKQIKINNGKEEENLDLVIWAGASNESYPFAVTKEGRVYAKDISIGSGLIDANTFITNVNGTLDSLQQQIDGEITSWFEAGTPIDINESGSNKIEVNENPPSDQWDTPEEKIKHEGDLYYDTNTQYCFRWIRKGIEPNYIWEWTQIADEGISEAMAAAAAAQTTAEGKSTVHYGTQDPTEIVGVTVNIGDLWVPGTSSGGSNVIKVYRGSSYGWVRAEDSQTKQETEKIVSDAIASSEDKISQAYQQAIQDALDGLEDPLYFETARLSQENSNVKIPAIILKAKDIDDNNNEIGLIYFNTESLVINSSNLKLNCYYGDDGLGYYQKGHLEINTTPLQLTPNKLVINIENTTFNGKIIAQEVASDAIRSINYSHVIENKASAPTLDNGGVQVGSYIFAKQGAFLDLNKGNLYTPNILLLGEEGDLILRGILQNWIKSNLGNKPNNLKFYMLLRPTQVQSTSTSYGSSIHTLFFDNVEIIYPAWWVLRKKTGDQYADWTNFENTEAPKCHFQNASSFKSEKWIDYSKLEIIQKEQKIIVNGEATLESDYWSDPLTSIQINDFNFGFDFDGLKTGSACINLQDQPSLAVGGYFSIDEDGYMINTRGSLGEAFKHSQGTVDGLYFYPSNSSSYTYDTLYSGSYFSNLDGKCGLLSQNNQSKENVFDLAKDIFLFAGAPIPIWEHKNSYSNQHTWWGDVDHANLKITTNGDLYLANFPVVRPTGYNPLQSTGTLSIVDWGNLLEERDITDNDSYAKNKIFNFLQMIDVKKVKQKNDPLNKYRFSLTTRELYQAADNPNQSLYPNEYFDPDVYACGLTYNYKYKTNFSSSIDSKSIGIRYDEIIAMLVVAAQEELKKQNDLRIVKSGTTTLTQSSGWTSKSVSFGKSLGSVPTVFCSVEHSGAAETAVYYYRITNVTTSGFTIYWYHNASSGSINLKWMAII